MAKLPGRWQHSSSEAELRLQGVVVARGDYIAAPGGGVLLAHEDSVPLEAAELELIRQGHPPVTVCIPQRVISTRQGTGTRVELRVQELGHE